ncbi:MAG TPA: class I SAM-dependent methyltransferase [Ferruginibacter sp.]|nr:class I SAM-dependent methyltransferase [Ferruginibacter sp.]
MNKEYVQQYVRLEKEHWWFVVRQKIILQFLKKYTKPQPIKILNIGAAGGASSEWLSTLGEVVSVETDPAFLNHLISENIPVVNASVVSMPFDNNYFDLVCAFDVIEHVEDDVAAIKEIERVCKAGGLICITVPAFNMLWSSHDVVNGHYRRYTIQSLLALTEKVSTLENKNLQYFNSLLFIPVLIARKISNGFTNNKKTAQSDFGLLKKAGVVNKIFKSIFSLEIPLLRVVRFPFGVSLVGIWKKSGSNK